MTYKNISDSAIETVCERPNSEDASDYAERSGYLLATFCNQCYSADKRYRICHGLDPAERVTETCVNLNTPFPLHPVFAPAAVYYLGAMLVADENEHLSEELFALYADALATIAKDLPVQTEPIQNRYVGSI